MGRCTAAALLRLLALYVCAIVGLQGIAAAQALGAGPLHHHHRDAGTAHQHTAAERHHHPVADSSVAAAPDGLDATASALLLALAAGVAVGTTPRCVRSRLRHVQRATPPWAFRTGFIRPTLRPPRTS